MAWRGTRQREERGQGMNEGWMDVDLNGMGWDWDDGSKKKNQVRHSAKLKYSTER